jgi:DNA-directed RNA polymerase subunit RPC12/RpoP
MISDKCTNDDSITNMTTENNQMYKNETEEKAVKYSCKACGNPFDANPPDDVHRFSSVYPCWKFDWIERSYQCSRCSKSIKLFWHPKVHKHHYDYATVEEIERKRSKNTLGNHPDYARRMGGY